MHISATMWFMIVFSEGTNNQYKTMNKNNLSLKVNAKRTYSFLLCLKKTHCLLEWLKAMLLFLKCLNIEVELLLETVWFAPSLKTRSDTQVFKMFAHKKCCKNY